MKKINDYIKIKNKIPKDYCNKIIEFAENKKFSKHSWANQYGEKVHSNNEHELEVLFTTPDCDLLNELNNIVKNFFKEYQDSFNLFQLKGHMPIRFNKYEVNTKMEPHVDHIHNLFDGKIKGIPILSMVGLLNDNFQDGQFVFNNEYEVNLKQGDLLIFPSNFIYQHQVNLITKGTRYSFVTWAV
tara:strand:+ start:1750 stop:2304 length:555 start_codon:yes stop_codon:yes gene_type:complete